MSVNIGTLTSAEAERLMRDARRYLTRVLRGAEDLDGPALVGLAQSCDDILETADRARARAEIRRLNSGNHAE